MGRDVQGLPDPAWVIWGKERGQEDTYSMSASLISSWMRIEGGKSTAERRGWGRSAQARGDGLSPPGSGPTPVHEEVDLSEDVLQGQALQRLQLCDF